LISIFYIEDEPFLAKIVKETLESKQYHVTLIADGSNAKEAFEASSYDICVLDIMVPNKNGYDIAKEIRSSNSQIPILFLTAKDQTADVLKGFEAGGNDYIRKPFSMEELIARIENFVRIAQIKAEQTSNEDIRLGEKYIFLPHSIALTSGDQTITLSHRECQILQLLCANINGVTKRKQILLEVWGDDSFYNSRNLDVYISKIRGYLNDDPTISIKTLKGVGYQFIIPE